MALSLYHLLLLLLLDDLIVLSSQGYTAGCGRGVVQEVGIMTVVNTTIGYEALLGGNLREKVRPDYHSSVLLVGSLD